MDDPPCTTEHKRHEKTAASDAAVCILLFDVEIITGADETRIGDLGVPLEDFPVALDAELVGNADQGVIGLDLIDRVAGLGSGLLKSTTGDFVHFVEGQFCAKFDIADIHHILSHVHILLLFEQFHHFDLKASRFHLLIRTSFRDGSEFLTF